MSDNPNFIKSFQKANFLTSVPSVSLLPYDGGSEVVFMGRSNSGKSSTINALCSRKKLAHTSRTPGRTQQFNFFSLGGECRLVDVPGFGYAKVSKTTQSRWHKEMSIYLQHRKSLRGLVLIMDIRNPLRDVEKSILTWSIEARLPVAVLLNKSDKTKKNYNVTIFSNVRSYLLKLDEVTEPNIIIFSAKKRTGLNELAYLLIQWLEMS